MSNCKVTKLTTRPSVTLLVKTTLIKLGYIRPTENKSKYEWVTKTH